MIDDLRDVLHCEPPHLARGMAVRKFEMDEVARRIRSIRVKEQLEHHLTLRQQLTLVLLAYDLAELQLRP